MKKEEIEDLIGKEYGRWKILEYDEVKSQNKHKTYFICQCSCGTIKSVDYSNLRSKSSKSCGCLKKEMSAENGKANKRENTYDLTGKFGIGYTQNGYEFYFDLEDYDIIKSYCWHRHRDGYLRTRYDVIDGKNKYILMHRLILDGINVHKEYEVDHINGKPNDNVKNNLRKISHSENMKNLKLYNTNTTGKNGVTYSKREKKYKVKLGKTNLGTYDNLEDAIKAREQEELKYGDLIREERDIYNGTR